MVVNGRQWFKMPYKGGLAELGRKLLRVSLKGQKPYVNYSASKVPKALVGTVVLSDVQKPLCLSG
jgi:hypothetical protein